MNIKDWEFPAWGFGVLGMCCAILAWLLPFIMWQDAETHFRLTALGIYGGLLGFGAQAIYTR